MSETINLEKVYEHRFQHISDEKKIAVWKVIANDIYQRMGAPKTVLDPCAGRCEFINNIPIEKGLAVDLQNIEEHTNSNVEFKQGDIFAVDIPENHFDGVFISNFLEHLPDAKAAADFINKMHSALKPSGKIAIMGPNFKYAIKEYFDCIDHSLILTHVSLEELLVSENFKVTKLYSRYLPYSFRSALPASTTLTSWYLKMPFAWKILGKQFLVIAEKR